MLAACAILLAAGLVPVWAQSPPSVELSLSRHVQSTGLLPTAGDYVLYDVTVKNTGTVPIENRMLWVTFAPTAGESEINSFFIPLVEPGQSKLIHIGPLKVHHADRYSLYIKISKSATAVDEVRTNFSHGVPADVIEVYSPALVQALPIGVVIVVAGAAILVWSYAKKKRA